MTTLESTQAALNSFDASVTRVEEVIRPLLAAVEAAKNDDTVPALTKARVHATLAYVVNALYYLYLKAHNVSTTQLDEELHRVQSLFARLRKVERKQGDEDASQQVNGLRVAAAKLDAFLTPDEAALAHAVSGALRPRQRHKRFSEDGERDASETKQKKRKKSVKKSEDVDVDMADVGEAPKNSSKKKKKSKKRSVEESVEPETLSTKVEPSEVEAASTEKSNKKKKKSRKSKKKAEPPQS